VLIPILYLKGVSTGDFEEALIALLGKDARRALGLAGPAAKPDVSPDSTTDSFQVLWNGEVIGEFDPNSTD
jgi:hypothetical protein